MCSMKLLLTLQKQLQSKTCAAIIEWPSFAAVAFGKSFNDCNYTFLLPKQKQLKLYEMPSLQQLHSNSMNDSLARHTSMEKINLDRNNLTEAFNGTELLQKHSINSIIEQRQDFLNQSYNNNDANNMDDIVLHNSNADRNNETFVNTITSIMHSGMFNDFLNLTETVQNPCNNAKGNLYNANLRLRNNILMSGSNDDINVGGPIATSNNAINNIDDLKNAMDNFQSNGTNNLTTVMSSNYMPLTPNSTQSSISPIISSSNTATINTFDIFPFGNIAPSLSSSSPQHQQQQLQLHEQEVQYKQLQSQTNLNHHHRQSLTETSQQIQKEQRQQRHHHLQQLSQQQSQHQQHLILTPPSSTIVTTTKTKTIAQQQQQQQQLPLKVFHRNINSFDCSALLSPTTPTTTLYNNSFQSCSPLVRESSNSSLANSGGLSLDPLSLTYQNICCNNNKTNNNNSNNMSNTNNNNNVNNNSSIQSTRSTTPESQNSHQSNENNVINITHQKQKQLQQYKQKQQYLEQQLQQQQQQQLPIQIPPQSAPQIQSLLHNSINQLNESLLSACNSNENASMDTYLDRIAKFHRGSAAFREATCTWSGQLPPSSHRLHQFSPKVFLGGIPWDISEESLIQIFKPFGQIKVEWPGKEHLAAQPKGYVYVIFESDKQVKSLLSACVVQMDVQHNSAGIFYFKISSRRIKAKDVEVIPWWIGDSNYVKSTSQKLDPTKTVFVGALHGKLTAEGLAKVMDDLFDGVVYAGIDTDKYKYPIGSGRVTFNNNRSYMKAVSAAFIEIRTTKFTKKVQIDPYLEDSLCSMCGVQHGPYYCRELSCFRYFCRTCWQWQHSTDDVKFHKPLTRNAKTQTLIGLGPAMSALSFALNSPNSITYGNTMQQQHQQQLSTSSSQLIRKQLNAARSLNSLETIVPMQQQQYLLNQTQQQQQQQQRQQEALCAAITSTAQKLQNLQNQLRL